LTGNLLQPLFSSGHFTITSGQALCPDLAAVTGLFFVKIRVVTDRSLPGDNRHQLRLLCHPNAF
jgi:hypothetical protein